MEAKAKIMKKILIIDGHPNKDSFVAALCKAYSEGALASGFEVQQISIRDLRFNPNLSLGYNQIQELEPDLVNAQKLILWCNHLVFAYPMWWGYMPALTKGFFDRSWLPGFAFKYHKTDPMWDKLLKGRSAHIIVTSDAPIFFNLFAYLNSPYVVVKKMLFAFCGLAPIKSTHIGGVKNQSDAKRNAWLGRIKAMGVKGQ
jgi:NAD(P)H dehydrogenase (quinone)